MGWDEAPPSAEELQPSEGLETRDRFHGLLGKVGHALYQEITEGHAPNAIEPTTAAQILAPGAIGASAEAPEAVNALRGFASGNRELVGDAAKGLLGMGKRAGGMALRGMGTAAKAGLGAAEKLSLPYMIYKMFRH